MTSGLGIWEGFKQSVKGWVIHFWHRQRQLGLVDPLPKWWILSHISSTSISMLLGSFILSLSLARGSGRSGEGHGNFSSWTSPCSWPSHSMVVSRSCTFTWQPASKRQKRETSRPVKNHTWSFHSITFILFCLSKKSQCPPTLMEAEKWTLCLERSGKVTAHKSM